MVLLERVFSLENEYGLNFYPSNQSKLPSHRLQRVTLVASLTGRYGIPGSDYLINGARIYADDNLGHDAGHPECSLPECRSALEVVAYDKAIETMLREALPAMEQRLASAGFTGKLRIIKNNRDMRGTSYGCHENYQTLRNTETLSSPDTWDTAITNDLYQLGYNDMLDKRPFLSYTSHCLMAFLVTRQILCGAGYIKKGYGSILEFCVSQRADFVKAAHSVHSDGERGIIDLSREIKAEYQRVVSQGSAERMSSLRGVRHQDEGPAIEGDMRRLHLILGDANLSGWATWMKLGMTGIVVRMIEDTFLEDVPVLAEPVTALHTVAYDPTCTAALDMADGTQLTAIAIQSAYLDIAKKYLELFGASAEERAIVREWEQALHDLQDHPLRLADRADWVFKKKQAEELYGDLWGRYVDQSIINTLLAFELRYHDIGPDGFFQQLRPTRRRNLVSEKAVRDAIHLPPSYTRAQVRSDIIALRSEAHVEVTNWGSYKLNGQTIDLFDPLTFAHPLLFAYCSEPLSHEEKKHQGRAAIAQRMLQNWQKALTHPNPAVRKRAIGYLSWWRNEDTVNLLTRVVQQDQEETVRVAAVRALAPMLKKSSASFDALLQCYLDTPDFAVRLALNELFAYIDGPM